MKKRHFISCFLFVYLIWGGEGLPWIFASDLNAFVFPQVAGWKQSEEIQTFLPKTLFEYINGGADLYLTYDFQELKVAEYSNGKKASVTVEVYRHRTPTYAFGIYSEERLPDANFVAIGTQGYIEENVLNFLAGSYYVKISGIHTGSDDQEILLSFAKKVAEQLGEKGTLPQILSSFPEEGKVNNSERFIPIKFLGYAFLHSAFIADYEVSRVKFKLFVIEGGDGNDCKDMIQRYLQQTGNPEKEVMEGRHKISDPYHGEIELQWQGKYIWGILNLTNSDLRSKYLNLLAKGLKKKASNDEKSKLR